MRKFIYILIFFASSSFLFARDAQKLVWPPPPDEPRIEYITSVKDYKDLGIEKGFFSKAFDFLFGEEDKLLHSPFGTHADGDRVYVTDIFYKEVYVFDKKKGRVITIEGSKKETFLYPIDVVTDKGGNIYVSDSVMAKVFVFDKDGEFSYNISLKEFQRPVGLSISVDGEKLYIVDALLSQIHVTTLKGKYLGVIGKKGNGDGEFNRPTFMDVGSDGKLYVSDSMNHRVQILDKDGKFISKFGQLGQEIGSFGSPRGISLDSQNNIYVSDAMFNNIQIFNQNGELLMVLGRYGNRKGEFSLPEDISITANNEIYITDVNNKRIEVFKLIKTEQTRSSK
jgi:DNA-binding beta-propeller fold protein YncE